MYEVIIRTYVNGKREKDGVYFKTYKRKGMAEKVAKEHTTTGENILNEEVRTEGYVRGVLKPVTEEEAKYAYCHGKHVYADSEYGKEMLRPSGEYGSHASREELFYRSASFFNYGNHYNGNYYIEEGVMNK